MATMSAQRGLNIATGLPSNMLEPATAGGGGSLSRPNRHASLRFASGTSDGGGAAGGSSSRDSSNRNTNRYSVTALYSMAAEQDTEIEDELARCTPFEPSHCCCVHADTRTARAQCSPETPTGSQGQDLEPVEAQLCTRTRCPLLGLTYSSTHPEREQAFQATRLRAQADVDTLLVLQWWQIALREWHWMSKRKFASTWKRRKKAEMNISTIGGSR